MRTEDYIIIILTVTASNEQIEIVYSSNAYEDNVTIQILAHNGRIVQSFEHVKGAAKGVLNFSSAGLLAGTYTCNISIDGKVKDSKQFMLA